MFGPANPRPSSKSTPRRLTALGAWVLALFAVACSPSADNVESTDNAASESPTTDDVAELSSEDCLALAQARMGIQGAGAQLIYAENAEFFETMVGDVAELRADIEALRPYQDIDPEPFGPIREGLDNFERDLNAASEGRFGDIAGDYSFASINSLLGGLCG